MVEIVRDHSTPPDPWWFLNPEVGRLAKPELVFVMQWLWHENPAKEFLWYSAAGGRIRWHAEIEILEDDPVFKTRAGLLTFNTAVNRGLSHPDYFSMDWVLARVSIPARRYCWDEIQSVPNRRACFTTAVH